MLMSWALLVFVVSGAMPAGRAQSVPVPVALPLAAVPMPPDRLEDSYAIYSQLMPGREYESEGWPRKLWLIEDTTTTVVEPGKPCFPGDASELVNPHNAIKAPAGREVDLKELLEDFDRNCHQRLTLTPESFQLSAPFRVLDESAQQRFWASRNGSTREAALALAQEFAGAPGLNSFSEVYFNAHHSLAMVYAGQPCGSLCGSWYWVVLEKSNGRWKLLPWVSVMTMS